MQRIHLGSSWTKQVFLISSIATGAAKIIAVYNLSVEALQVTRCSDGACHSRYSKWHMHVQLGKTWKHCSDDTVPHYSMRLLCFLDVWEVCALSTYTDKLMGIKCNLRAFKKIKTGNPTNYKWTHLVNRVYASCKDNQCQMQKSFGPVPQGTPLNLGQEGKQLEIQSWHCVPCFARTLSKKVVKLYKWHLVSHLQPLCKQSCGVWECYINHCIF